MMKSSQVEEKTEFCCYERKEEKNPKISEFRVENEVKRDGPTTKN